MAVNSEKDLPESQRATWLKATSAMQLRNYGYVIQLLQLILKNHPDFLMARQLTRKAAIAKSAGKKSMLSGLSSVSFPTLKVQGLIKKDPLAAMMEVEKMLENDPFSSAGNQLLKEAALTAKMPEVALFALETIVEGSPKDTKTMHELAQLYMANRLPHKAIDVYNKIQTLVPNDLVAVKGAKDAAAANSMQRGGWERQDATYRDILKNQDEAKSLEQQNRVHRDEDMIDSLLTELHAKLEKDPQNVDTSRRIAEAYEQKNDLDNALQWYTHAAGLTGNTDSSIVRKMTDTRLKQFDASIASWEAWMAENAGTEEAKQYAPQLEEIRQQRAQVLLDEAKKRVDRNPTDLQLHFELGEILVNSGNYRAAIASLQKARTSPNVRLRAMNLLGRCYGEQGMLDLAANTFETAASEIHQMDNVKKDIVYNLGLIREKMGQKDKYIECMKQIYEVDYGYRDVAERVEGSYADNNA